MRPKRRCSNSATRARASAWRRRLRAWRGPLVIGLCTLSFRAFAYDHYHIPSESMQPMLQIGSHIVVNKMVYGTQIPWTSSVVATPWRSPVKRGDVVVFRYPLDPSQDYVKRVIALPGDTVRVEGEAIAIQRQSRGVFERIERVATRKACHESHTSSAPEPSGSRCRIFRETLDGRSYDVRYEDIARAASTIPGGQFRVPKDAFFVLGDNRQASQDSLRWQGRSAETGKLTRRPFVPRGHVTGRVDMVF